MLPYSACLGPKAPVIPGCRYHSKPYIIIHYYFNYINYYIILIIIYYIIILIIILSRDQTRSASTKGILYHLRQVTMVTGTTRRSPNQWHSEAGNTGSWGSTALWLRTLAPKGSLRCLSWLFHFQMSSHKKSPHFPGPWLSNIMNGMVK